MSIDGTAPLQAIRTLIDNAIKTQLTTPGAALIATIGAPESFPNRVSGYVAASGPVIIHKNVTQLQCTQWYWGVLGYKVKGAEETAELALTGARDALILAFYTAKVAKTGLFAQATTQVESGDIDFSPSSAPDYQAVAAAEYRLQPFLIHVQQTDIIPHP